MRRAALLLPLLLAPGPVAASAGRLCLALAPDASQVRIELDATLHTVPGHFRVARGELCFPPGGGPVSGRVVVDATSGRTGIAARDRVMHEDVLASARHPEIRLRPETLVVRERGPDSLAGILRGVVAVGGREGGVEIDFRAERSGGRGAVEASFEIPYVAWGLPDPSRLVLRVGKSVRVRVSAEGALRAASAAPP